MKNTFENETLFDDVAVLESKFGQGCLNATSINANCDCSGYTDTQDDEGTDTPQIA